VRRVAAGVLWPFGGVAGAWAADSGVGTHDLSLPPPSAELTTPFVHDVHPIGPAQPTNGWRGLFLGSSRARSQQNSSPWRASSTCSRS
jgi:hypothetical protein